jgi:DNA mismatch repair ATPase MutS
MLKGYCLFATHFWELSLLEKTIPAHNHYFQYTSSKMTYSLERGVNKNSFGITIM